MVVKVPGHVSAILSFIHISVFHRKTVPNSDIVELDFRIGHYPQWEDPEGLLKAFFQFQKSLPI